ncbi:hypothetical protein Fmac_020519 [Flemingia macrophylla]|uniref:Bifunctional inhibitor/plant lipid transfer protein/seed storage helical domain-containing protein n=1 Tax=Flemingia macrophylla TaxID=520843 RepID=A0ABD1LUC3_9FABA
MCYKKTKAVAHMMLLATVMVGIAMGESSKDKDECTQQLVGLSSCLPYVGGQAQAPAPDCCSGLKQLLKSNKKCLCLIIKDRNDPDLGGLQINATLALNLPTACNSPVNVSKCPAELLHMDPKSPDAQVFYQLQKGSSTTPAPSPSAGARPSISEAASTSRKNDAFCMEKGLFGQPVWASGLLFWAFIGLFC